MTSIGSAIKRLFDREDRGCLSLQQIELFQKQGYIVLERFFDDDLIGLLDQEIDRAWATAREEDSPLVIDFCEGPYAGERMYLKDAPDGSREYSHKLNDLFLESENYRDVCLHADLVKILKQLLGHRPVVINSLCFLKGSQQEDHFDTYFMPPRTDGNLIVTWICLEDVKIEAGPVRYYPGSHLIRPFRFANEGTFVSNEDEREAAREYARQQIEEQGLEVERFMGKKGDVLVWHGSLYHGGDEILDPDKTRKSAVTHYWAEQDVPEGTRASHGEDGFYGVRPHQPVPSE